MGVSAVHLIHCSYHKCLMVYSRRAGGPHAWNPASGQWRQHFTPRVRREFYACFGIFVCQLGYPAD